MMQTKAWLLTLFIPIAHCDILGESPPSYPSPWMQPQGIWTEPYRKAVEFVNQLTLLEKVNLTTGVGFGSDRCLGNTGAIPRLNFSGLCLQDTPVFFGTFADFASAFPSGVNTGATFSRDYAYMRGQALGYEYRLHGADVLLRPVISPLGRFPEGGRNWEGFSPDPYLSGEMVAPTIKGMQSNGIMASVKHYIANEQEHFRQTSEAFQVDVELEDPLSVSLDDRTMHELYLWPFANAIRANVASVMCAYNAVNNSAGCGNSYTLNHLLKRELGFQGFVLTDWGAHHGGVSSALAGLDMSMPGDFSPMSGTSFWGANLTLAVLNGTLPEWRLDDMCTRIMTGYYLVGRDRVRAEGGLGGDGPNFQSWTTDEIGRIHAFSPISLVERVNEDVYVRANHRKLIRELGAASVVLLKNEGNILPLSGNERHIGLFGSDAGSNPYGANGCRDRACNNGTLAQGWGSGSFLYPYLITPDMALTMHISQNTNGSVSTITQNYGADSQIADLAQQASVSLVFVNSNSGEGYATFEGNYGDRNNMSLWLDGDNVIKKVANYSRNTIVIIHSGGPILVSEWYEHPNVTAILWAGMPGQESGNSLVDVLYGKVNPRGRLPFTIGKKREDWGPLELLYEPNNGKKAPQQDLSGLDIDYRYFDVNGIEPAYAFGFGLSYTNFSMANVTIKPLVAASKPYLPSRGVTDPAPVRNSSSSPRLNRYDNTDSNFLKKFAFPSGFLAQPQYIYPYLNSTDPRSISGMEEGFGLPASEWLPANVYSTKEQPVLAAGGSNGGNPSLWESVYRVEATIRNTGKRDGYAVPQVYIRLLDGPEPRMRVLRGFDSLSSHANGTVMFTAELSRRDIAWWDVGAQDWRVAKEWEVEVGWSSRDVVAKEAVQM